MMSKALSDIFDMHSISVPVRIDLAGGWTDVGPYPHDYGGEVVNFTIDKRVTISNISKNKFEDNQIKFDVPRGAGLGTSSAMNVAINAIKYPNLYPHQIAKKAFEDELKSGNICGKQDHWASAHGGFNHLLFIGESVEILPFEPMKSSLNWLRKHLIISFSGITRDSGKMQEIVWKRYANGDEDVINGLFKIRSATKMMANGLQADRRDLIVKSLREVSTGVDEISRDIQGPFKSVTEDLIENNKIVAWKALGAGGGGCAALLCAPNCKDDVIAHINHNSWRIINWDYDHSGIIINN